MRAAWSEAASASELNCGLRRDLGMVRMSISCLIPLARNSSMKCSMGCVEWPMVKIVSCGVAVGISANLMRARGLSEFEVFRAMSFIALIAQTRKMLGAGFAHVFRPNALFSRRQNSVGIEGVLDLFVEAQQRVFVEGIDVHHVVHVGDVRAVFAPAVIGAGFDEAAKDLAVFLVEFDVMHDREAE